MTRLALLPVFCLFLLPGYTCAQDETLPRLTGAGVLKDIGSIKVWIPDLPDDFESFGLHRDDIQRDVELKLRIAGITIDDDGVDYIKVNLYGTCDTTGHCYFTMSVAYIEPVFVQRGDESKRSVGITWLHMGPVGDVGGNKLRSFVRDLVKDLVDEFINDYLTANPKQ